ncbi:ALP1-like protein [Tanacetum coccineum]
MSQINSECLFFDDTDDETEVNSLLSGFLIDAALVIQASTPTIQKYQRSYMPRDRYGAHDRLVLAYFAKKPFYNAYLFRKRFRMNRSLFTRIVRDLSANCPYFQEGCDAVGKAGISALVKRTSAIRQLAYAAVPYSLDEYLQIDEKPSRDCLMHFCNGVIELYGEDRGDSGSEPFILLEAVASQDLWIWHAFFGVAGSNNDANVLRQSPVLNGLKVGKASEVPFVANDVTYKWGYYLTDEIYPEWAVLMKSISQPESNDVKRIRYKQAHEAARKDVERSFGVLKKKWVIVRTPTRSRSLKRITHLMYTFIILHNMIRKEKEKAISPDFYPEEQHREDDPIRSAQYRLRVIREIHDEETHLNLKADLVEHIWHRTNGAYGCILGNSFCFVQRGVTMGMEVMEEMEMEGMDKIEMEIEKWESWHELWRFHASGSRVHILRLLEIMVPDEEDRVDRFIRGLPNNIQGNGYATRSAENKRRIESNPRDNHGQQPPFKRQNVSGQNVARAYTAGNNERKGVGHQMGDCRSTAAVPNTQKVPLGNQQVGNKTKNQTGGNEATARAYTIGGGGTNPDSNVVTGTFLLNNCYASMLFDSGADRSFVSSTFSALLDVDPSTLDTSYAIELADGRISETNVVLKGCTL